MNKRGIICLFLTILCSLRAFQLYWSSTRELRSVDGHSWFPSKKKSDMTTTTTTTIVDKLKNDSIVLGAESNNIFYFLHVNFYKKTKIQEYFINNLRIFRLQIFIYLDIDQRDIHTISYISFNLYYLLSSK